MAESISRYRKIAGTVKIVYGKSQTTFAVCRGSTGANSLKSYHKTGVKWFSSGGTCYIYTNIKKERRDRSKKS
jgi:hypothetical protein